MRIGPAAIVAIVVLTEAKFQHFTQLFQEVERLVDSRRARARKLSLIWSYRWDALGCSSLAAIRRRSAMRCGAIR